MTDLRALHIALRKAKLAREDMAAHICDLQDPYRGGTAPA